MYFRFLFCMPAVKGKVCAVKPVLEPKKRLTKQELLAWASYLYSRYEGKYRARRLLNMKLGGAIINADSNHDKRNK